MSQHLLVIERLLAENDISAGYLSATDEFPMAQLQLDFSATEEEDNSLSLQICHIPVPESPVFILQFFIQLPLPPPFKPDAAVPEFLVGGLQKYIACLNQMLPIVGFNSSQQDLYFRSSLVLEEYSGTQIIYYLELLHHLLVTCLPSLQSVAIGLEDADEAIQKLPQLFALREA